VLVRVLALAPGVAPGSSAQTRIAVNPVSQKPFRSRCGMRRN
jgi:hypothetical protein